MLNNFLNLKTFTETLARLEAISWLKTVQPSRICLDITRNWTSREFCKVKDNENISQLISAWLTAAWLIVWLFAKNAISPVREILFSCRPSVLSDRSDVSWRLYVPCPCHRPHHQLCRPGPECLGPHSFLELVLQHDHQDARNEGSHRFI